MQLSTHDGLLSIPGILAQGVAAGIKKNGRRDVAIIFSASDKTTGAAVFTQNAYAAAPVHVSRQHVADGDLRAIVCNSGNANACTGRQGLRDALTMAEDTAAALGIRPDQVLVTSTGIIGRQMPIDKIRAGISNCAATLSDAVGDEAAQAILTTDSGPKQASATFTANGHTYRIAGICKGAGMIHPNMATMLAFMATDAPVQAPALRAALRQATALTFNQISVDGDESTNDTAAIIATGVSPGRDITTDTPGFDALTAAITTVSRSLAQQIAADGEGATRLLEVVVDGTQDDVTARAAARAVASSTLVKAAIHGSDPNWGRIIAALGAKLRDIDAGTTTIDVGDGRTSVTVLDSGEPIAEAIPVAADLLKAAQAVIHIKLPGHGHGIAWGCDVTEEYVRFNSAYTT